MFKESVSRYKLLSVANSKCRIGILGGSFNPAHLGHRYISIEAIKRLNLDCVIWLVTPQNPLKSLDIQNSLRLRLEYAKKISNHSKIKVLDFEKYLKTNYTVNTVRRLSQMHQNAEFIWLMGADNIKNFHKWREWKVILKSINIAVLDRDANFNKIAASKLKTYLKAINVLLSCPRGKTSKMMYIRIRKNPMSSTEIRKQNGK